MPPEPRAVVAAPPPEAASIGFKPGRGLVVTSADGNYELGAAVRLQFLSITEHARDSDTRQAFQLRRARFNSTGHIATPELKYRFELAFGPRELNPRDGVPQTSPLLDAAVDWQHFRDLNVRVGQYKVPLDRQRIIPFFRLQFIDRAITDTEFTFDRDVGLDLRSNDLFGLNLFRYYIGVFTGDGRNSFDLSDLSFTYLARAEILPFGMFDDYSEGDFDRGGLRLSLGAAYLSIEDAPRDRGILGAVPADGGTTDMQVATADALLQFRGMSIMAAIFMREGQRNPGPLVDAAGAPLLGPDGAPLELAPSRDGTGLLVQGGYLLPGTALELAARYAVLDGRSERDHDALVRAEEFAGAINYYFARHQLKLQANYARLVNNGDYGGALGRMNVQLQAAF
jgi:phosphate-selective porin OprO and OprP